MLHNADGLGSFSSSSLPRLRQRRGLAVQGKSQIPPMDGELFGRTFIVNPSSASTARFFLCQAMLARCSCSHCLVPELKSSVQQFTGAHVLEEKAIGKARTFAQPSGGAEFVLGRPEVVLLPQRRSQIEMRRRQVGIRGEPA